MSISLYKTPNYNSEFSAFLPFTLTFDGRIGGAQDRQVFIRNHDASRWYSNIQIQAVDSAGLDLTDNSVDGFMWKLLSKDIVPTEEEWAQVTAGASLSLSDSLGSSSLGNTVTFLPVWIRVQIPRGQSIQTIKDIVLRITATEGLVE